jgi:hypothetical protein
LERQRNLRVGSDNLVVHAFGQFIEIDLTVREDAESLGMGPQRKQSISGPLTQQQRVACWHFAEKPGRG